VLADDTADIRAFLRLWLETLGGFTVVAEVGDGAAAVAAVARELPEAIVLDLGMPGMGGLEAIPGIKRASPGTKIVVFSACDEEDAGPAACALGAHAYLLKGTDPCVLVRMLGELCGA
jgi:DNA-binding NarL/FixJ family response regulator